ncbi:class I SAM-dependent methyltransferase [Bacillus sp. ISL-40]|uniref:class I SAM-dependent methyltransferase n=1 Tax=unclassified Bacillus (in: firmicutes) TaxID=185979 RepID=UPI001BE79C22|nr:MULTISPECIES: class I SAM-dependent methyltransferase [unclassified Bacillus (in: firmicutes)]MBT2701402.1 class I SAM-dependent methyltransferase [Bacillus sp. ISL-40]MBT2743991.1 class I SAM-dependent methyltransferase [Bacillus sp. ISL-77]
MASKVKEDSWNANLYDKKHSFVSQFGVDLVQLLAPKSGEKILDLGCGTGDLANQLNQLGVDIIGIDKSENMIQQAQKKYPGLTFKVQDAVNMGYTNEFDAVFSNATLHWIKTPKQALQSIYNALNPGGRFVAEFGGKGNVQKIIDAIINQLGEQGITYKSEQLPWYYPSIGEYTSMMEQVGFRVTHAQHFDRPTPLSGEQGLRNWIEMFATSMFEGVTTETKELIITRVEENSREVLFRNGEWIADYKRIRVLGIKE